MDTADTLASVHDTVASAQVQPAAGGHEHEEPMPESQGKGLVALADIDDYQYTSYHMQVVQDEIARKQGKPSALWLRWDTEAGASTVDADADAADSPAEDGQARDALPEDSPAAASACTCHVPVPVPAGQSGAGQWHARLPVAS